MGLIIGPVVGARQVGKEVKTSKAPTPSRSRFGYKSEAILFDAMHFKVYQVAPALAKSPVDRHGIRVLEILDHEIQSFTHEAYISWKAISRLTLTATGLPSF